MAYPSHEPLVTLALTSHREFVRSLFDLFDRVSITATDPIDAARKVLGMSIPLLAELIGDAALASMLCGASAVGRRLPRVSVFGNPRKAGDRTINWDGSPAWMPIINAAYRSMRGLTPLLDWVWEAARVETRRRAFFVTGLATQQAVNDVQKTLNQAITQGLGFRQWYDIAKKSLATSGIGVRRAVPVYRFNLSRAFHSGQELIASDPIVGDNFPYVFVFTIPDIRRSEACRTMSFSGLDGTACYRRDDPSYIRNKTPRHPNCRCRDTFMTIRQAADFGVREAQEWLKTGRPPIHPQHVKPFEVKMPQFLADERRAETASAGQGVVRHVA